MARVHTTQELDQCADTRDTYHRIIGCHRVWIFPTTSTGTTLTNGQKWHTHLRRVSDTRRILGLLFHIHHDGAVYITEFNAIESWRSSHRHTVRVPGLRTVGLYI